MIKAVLFDLDGTIINTNNLIIQSFKYTFKKHLNLDVETNTIVSFFGEPLGKSMEKYDKENADKMVSIYREYNLKVHDDLIESFEGIEETLIELKKSGLKLAIVTSKRRVSAERGLNVFNLKDYFDLIITPEDTEIHKPNGEPALKACELLDISPDNALMVGDSHNDILCGKNAGTKTCLVKYSILPLEELIAYNPDYAVENLYDIIEIIDSENRKMKSS